MHTGADTHEPPLQHQPPSVAGGQVATQALLIETVEPPQNRKRGDESRAVEFIQHVDPAVAKAQLLNQITASLK